jgi:Flp pilus assembly pilin Flp
MSHRIAAAMVATTHRHVTRARRSLGAEDGQGTVEYAGLAMAIGVLLLAVGSYLGGKDHGIGSVVTSAIKNADEQAAGGGGK